METKSRLRGHLRMLRMMRTLRKRAALEGKRKKAMIVLTPILIRQRVQLN